MAGWLNSSEVIKAVISQTVFQTKPQDVFKDQTTMTLLLLGCDETRDPRTKQILKKHARSDMMLLAKLDFVRNRISGLSISRDIEAYHPEYGIHKINAFHDFGGPQASKQVVEETIGVPVDRVVVLDYDAFKRIVDLVGGVEVFIEKPLKYTDTWGDLYVDLKPGKQLLDGEQAMGYVRIRKVDSDFGRQERQRGFLLSVKEAVARNTQMLPKVADETVRLLGNELTPVEVASLMLFAQRVGADNIKMDMVPIVERRHSTNLDIDRQKLEELLEKYGFTANSDPLPLNNRHASQY